MPYLGQRLKTVRDLLEYPNPEPRPTGMTDNYSQGDYVNISLSHVRPLKGFDVENIHAMYEDLLETKLRLSVVDLCNIDEIQRKIFELKEEKELDDMCKEWFPQTVTKCIQQTVGALQKTLGVPQQNFKISNKAKFKREKAKKSLRSKGSSKIVPDWAVVSLVDEEKIYVCGDSKKRNNFDPRLLDSLEEYKDVDFKKDAMEIKFKPRALIWALKQGGTYALLAKSRYFFFITTDTVTALRYFLVKSAALAADTVLGVEYAWFPYLNSGVGKLTCNKTIWTYTMMSQNDQHRQLVPKKEMLDLDLWYYLQVEGKSYYIHHLSEAVKKTRPPGQIQPTVNARRPIYFRLLIRCREWKHMSESEKRKAMERIAKRKNRRAPITRSILNGRVEKPKSQKGKKDRKSNIRDFRKDIYAKVQLGVLDLERGTHFANIWFIRTAESLNMDPRDLAAIVMRRRWESDEEKSSNGSSIGSTIDTEDSNISPNAD